MRVRNIFNLCIHNNIFTIQNAVMVKKKGLLGLVILCFLPSNEDERLITVITASQCAQVSQCEHFLVV